MITREQLLQLHTLVTTQALSIMKDKNSDYGGNNDALRNFRLVEQLGIPMEIGILTRLADKIARISNIITKGSAAVKDETVYDTILDGINYLVILYAALTEDYQVTTLADTPHGSEITTKKEIKNER
jgi:hypothetical protein